MLKKFRKNICIHIFTFYVLTYSFVKKGIFLWLCKKDKKCVAKRLILVPNFFIIYIGNIQSFFFLKPLHGHLGHGDLHTPFLFEFFIYSHICKNLFQINGAYAPRRKKCRIFTICFELVVKPPTRHTICKWWIYLLHNDRITRIDNTWKTIRD
jgi:hypothetical protein